MQTADGCSFLVNRSGLQRLKLFVLTTAVLALITLQPSTVIRASVQVSQSTGSLDTLTHKTGWIPLGALTADSRRWAGGSDPNVPYMTGPFEILGRRVDRRKPILPKVGDRIRVTARQEIVIIDYARTGEQRRLTAPSSVTSISRPLGAADRTGLHVEAGEVLEVRAVKISRPLGQIRAAWARVSPSVVAGK